mmetsp:Transcript_33450/g.40993  ORF Transcript_33450/g.40993 Transcript_33450/m.40993 type:complete len:84 (+) Transcript_33450:296-547(+)
MGKKGLEMFKFGVYLTIPVLTVMFFNTPEAIKALIEKKQYIVYPPEGPRPIRGSTLRLLITYVCMYTQSPAGATEGLSSLCYI